MTYLYTRIQKMKKQLSKKGFTLVEALVSLGIFSIVVVSATGVILSVISSNKKNQAVSSVVNNLNYSIESMIRDIKTGYRYHCGIDPVNNLNSTVALDPYKLLSEDCSANVPIPAITLISTITGKEQVVRYELFPLSGGADAYIKKTLYTDTVDGSGNVTVNSVSYPLTDQNNITIDKLEFRVSTPESLIPANASTGQPSVFLILKGTAKINQINIADFFIQTYISQRLPNFI
jgi:prepilin-type N-terminal cleavage/methylation domain-containing protein